MRGEEKIEKHVNYNGFKIDVVVGIERERDINAMPGNTSMQWKNIRSRHEKSK